MKTVNGMRFFESLKEFREISDPRPDDQLFHTDLGPNGNQKGYLSRKLMDRTFSVLLQTGALDEDFKAEDLTDEEIDQIKKENKQ